MRFWTIWVTRGWARARADAYIATLGAAITALVASCESSPPKFPDPNVFVEIVDAAERPVRFGELRPAKVTVFNSTVQPMLIRSISLDDQLPICLDLMASLDGRIVERKTFDAWDYQPHLPAKTPRVFADDTLLLPGEKTIFDAGLVRIRFREQGATVWWQTISVVDLLRNAFFPVRSPSTSTQRFGRVSYTALQSYREAQPGTLERMVLLPNIEPGAAGFGSIRSTNRRTRVPIQNYDALTTAVNAVGATRNFSSATHWIGGEMWVVDDFMKKRTAAVTKDGTVMPMPRCELEIFDLFDLLGNGAEAIEVHQPDGRRALVTSSADIFALFKSARDAGHELRVETFEDEDGLPISVVAVAAPGSES